MATDTTGNLHAAIYQQHDAYMAAYARGDAVGLVEEVYTDRARMLAPGRDVIEGRGAIARFFQEIMDSGIAAIHLSTTELEKHGDAVFEVGKAELTDAQGHLHDRATFILLWTHESGRWMIDWDIYKSDIS